MLTVLGERQHGNGVIGRRQLLQAGGAGLLGLSLPKLLAAEASQPFSDGRAKSVIFMFLFGGPSQLETFDMKPEAPRDIRGPFKAIKSRTPGLLMCEHLPRLAEVSDKFAVLRTMTHEYNDHSGAGHYIQTGHQWHVPIGGGFNVTPRDWPSVGSVVKYFTEHSAEGMSRDIPSYVVLPNFLGRLQNFSSVLRRPGETAGWLGRGYDPLNTSINKRSASDNPYWRDCTDEELNFRVQGLAPREDLTIDRVQRRRSLLKQFNAQRRLAERSRAVESFDQFQQRAYSLVASAASAQAFDIRQEPDKLRDRYGRHLLGQSTLMARRLVEAGVRFATVHYDACDGYSWDSHRNSDDVKKHLLPSFDQALSALLVDLDERGMLDETLVVAMGEMGRTPKANKTWGRGHWSTLFPAVIAGAGVRGGVVHGHSDKIAAHATDNPTRPEDIAATIYSAFGIDPHTRINNAAGRPSELVAKGKPLTHLFG